MQAAYSALAPIVGPDAEPWPVVQLVAEHRNYWRPAKTRVLLLAESHVYTRISECVPMVGSRSRPGLCAPNTYVRLVYCLGYGESRFVGAPIKPNPGTPQFWKIFASCLYQPSEATFAPLLSSRTPDYSRRLDAKVHVLRELQRAGIWLLDASLLAQCHPGGERLSPASCTRMLRSSWQLLIRDQIRDLAPEAIVVIGKGVAGALAAELSALNHSNVYVQPQPQAHLPADAVRAVHERYFDICRQFTQRAT